MGFQQVEHRFPVVRRRLHHHPFDAEPDQVVGQRDQRAGHREMLRYLLQPFAPATLAGYPDTAHHFGLADIQGSNPLDDLVVISRFVQHRPDSSPLSSPHL